MDALSFTDFGVHVSGSTLHAWPIVDKAEPITINSGGGESEELEDSDV